MYSGAVCFLHIVSATIHLCFGCDIVVAESKKTLIPLLNSSGREMVVKAIAQAIWN